MEKVNDVYESLIREFISEYEQVKIIIEQNLSFGFKQNVIYKLDRLYRCFTEATKATKATIYFKNKEEPVIDKLNPKELVESQISEAEKFLIKDMGNKLNRLDSEINKEAQLHQVQQLISDTCDKIKEMLLEKNRKYGNSALIPKRIFSKANPIEQINVRIDDKLSRIESAQKNEDEDVELDLLGYLILKQVANGMAGVMDKESKK